jgi:hypothetical protein
MFLTKHEDRKREGERYMEKAPSVFWWEDTQESQGEVRSQFEGKREEGRMHAEVYLSSSFGHAYRARAENGVGDTLGAWAQRLGT